MAPSRINRRVNDEGQSDECLQERIRNALRSSSRVPIPNVQACVDQGTVILHGRVPSYYLKQLAQTTVMALDEVESLRNEVKVNAD